MPTKLPVLIAWLPDQGRALAQRLRRDTDCVDLTVIRTPDLSNYLSAPDAYTVLCLTPEAWGNLPRRQRKRILDYECAIILGPQPADLAIIPEMRTVVTIKETALLEDALVVVSRLIGMLGEGRALSDAMTGLGGILTWHGQDMSWQAPCTPQVEPEKKSLITDHTPAVLDQLPDMLNLEQGLGNMEVKGDFVNGPKIVYKAAGDQVVMLRAPVAKVVQQAGESQVNINRVQSSSVSIDQSSANEQVNINRIKTEEEGAKCPCCGGPVTPTDRFCMSCNADLTRNPAP